MRKAMILVVLLAACDKKKSSPEEALARVQESRAARLKASEGKTFYAALPLAVTEANFAHAQRDCPPHQADLAVMGRGADANKKMYREVQLQLKNGKFIEASGAVHEPLFCNRCYR